MLRTRILSLGGALSLVAACSASSAERRYVLSPQPARPPVETAAASDVPTTDGPIVARAALPIDLEPEEDRGAGASPARQEPFEPYPFQAPLPEQGDFSRSPARRYANLSPAACRTELKKRGLPTKPSPLASPGVATPLRITGKLGSVRFITPGDKSVYGTLDCRLVLALRDFADLLVEHRVVAVHVDNSYRPKAHLPGRKRKRSQHAYGLAIDIRAFTLEDGRVLLVERDFHAELGTAPCGPESRPREMTEESIALHDIACAAARRGLFHHLLTPHYNEAHRDHLHFDIKRDAGPTVIR